MLRAGRCGASILGRSRVVERSHQGIPVSLTVLERDLLRENWSAIGHTVGTQDMALFHVDSVHKLGESQRLRIARACAELPQMMRIMQTLAAIGDSEVSGLAREVLARVNREAVAS